MSHSRTAMAIFLIGNISGGLLGFVALQTKPVPVPQQRTSRSALAKDRQRIGSSAPGAMRPDKARTSKPIAKATKPVKKAVDKASIVRKAKHVGGGSSGGILSFDDEISAEEGGDIPVSVSVEFQSGALDRGADIHVNRGGDVYTLSWEGEGAKLEMLPGKVVMWAVSYDDSNLISSRQEVIITEKGPNKLHFVYESMPGIMGVIEIPDSSISVETSEEVDFGDEDEEFFVWWCADPYGETEIKTLIEMGEEVEAEEGRFVITGINPGRYLVGVGLQEHRVDQWLRVTVGNDLEHISLKLPELTDKDWVMVAVKDSDGKLLEGVDFTYVYELDGESFSVYAHSERLEDGEFRVLALKLENGQEDREIESLELQISEQEHGTLTVEVDPDFKRLDVAFQEAGSIEFRFDGVTKRNSERPVVLAAGSRQIQVQPKGGSVKLGSFQPGSIILRISMFGDQGSIPIIQKEFMVRSGVNVCTINLQDIHDQVIENVPHTGMVIVSNKPPGEASSFYLNLPIIDGEVHAKNVPAGEYWLWTSDQQSVLQISIPLTEPIQWRSSPVSLEVSIEKDGYLSERGFVSGDRIIGVDGALFKETTKAAIFRKLSGKSAELFIQRGSTTLSITVDPRKLNSLGAYLGGDVEDN